MKQSKNKSLVETITQTFIGLIVSILIQRILFPIMDIPVNFGQNIIITIVFTAVSIIRGYVIRRIFNK